jgi:hypothetical protein
VKVAPGPSRVTGRGLLASSPINKHTSILNIREDAKQDAPLFHHVNHSCDAAACITRGGILKSLCRLKVGEEVTINYLQSCDFTDGFQCECGSYKCAGWIEKKLDPTSERVAPGLWIAGQPGAVVLRVDGKVLAEK